MNETDKPAGRVHLEAALNNMLTYALAPGVWPARAALALALLDNIPLNGAVPSGVVTQIRQIINCDVSTD